MARRRRRYGDDTAIVAAGPSRSMDWTTVGWGLAIAGGGCLVWSAFVDAAPRSSRPAIPTTKWLFVDGLKTAIASVAAIPAPALPLAIAHAAYESAWGRTTGYRKANNPWNITAGSGWSGPTVPGPDTDGSGNPITQQWRSYPDFSSAAADYWNFLGSFRYVAAQNAMGAGDPTFATLLGQEGYYTQDQATYQSNINSIIGSVQTYLGLMP